MRNILLSQPPNLPSQGDKGSIFTIDPLLPLSMSRNRMATAFRLASSLIFSWPQRNFPDFLIFHFGRNWDHQIKTMKSFTFGQAVYIPWLLLNVPLVTQIPWLFPDYLALFHFPWLFPNFSIFQDSRHSEEKRLCMERTLLWKIVQKRDVTLNWKPGARQLGNSLAKHRAS